MKKHVKIKIIFMFLMFVVLFLYSDPKNKDDCSKRGCMKTISDLINSYVIVIDPGHGGTDAGALSSKNIINGDNKRYKESDMVLDIAKKLKDYLSKTSNKLTVKLTRMTNTKKSAINRAETTRTEIKNKVKAEKCEKTHPIFLSIHLNSNESSLDNNEACNSTHGHEELWAFLEGNRQPQELLNEFDSYGFKNRGLVDGSKKGVLRYGPLCLKDKKVSRLNSDGEVMKDRKGNVVYLYSGYSKSIITQNSLSEVDFICNDIMAKFILTTSYGHSFIASIYVDYIVNKIIKDINDIWFNSDCFTFKLNDDPDDNESYSSGVMRWRGKGYGVDIRSKVLTSIEFINPYTVKMLNSIGERPAVYFRELTKDMVKEHPVLVIPYGSLSLNQNNISLKETLKQYVQSGGTIIVFAQQYGHHVENIIPVPEGEELKVYGWREDQSCYNGSVYGSIIHPVLSSMVNDRASVAVDGYIDQYPKDSVVLLRRTKNRKPALLYYKYGEGTVILTTLYTDWGYAHSQASSSELNIVRDLLTFARDTESEIPMYNITETANPKIKLNLKLRNDTEYDAVKAKIRVLTPSRDIFKASKPSSCSSSFKTVPCSKLFNPLLSKGAKS